MAHKLNTDKREGISHRQLTPYYGKDAGPIDDYCRDISVFPILTDQEQKELARRIQQGTGSAEIMFAGTVEIERRAPGFIRIKQPPSEITEKIGGAISDMEQNKLLNRCRLSKGIISIELYPGATIDVDIPRYYKTERKTLRLRYRTLDATIAREKIVTANLALVIKIAKSYASGHIEDLIGYGNIGLIEAADTFDPNRNIPFPNYAGWWINKAMKYNWVNNEHYLRVQGLIYRKMIFIKKIERELTAASTQYPTNEEIFDEIERHKKNGNPQYVKQIGLRDVQRLRPLYKAHVIPMDEEVFTLLDTTTKNPVDTVISDEIFYELLPSLPERSEKIMHMRFGDVDTAPMGYPEIGRELKLTGERVRQIKVDTIKDLQAIL